MECLEIDEMGRGIAGTSAQANNALAAQYDLLDMQELFRVIIDAHVGSVRALVVEHKVRLLECDQGVPARRIVGLYLHRG